MIRDSQKSDRPKKHGSRPDSRPNRYYRRKVCVFCTNGWIPDYKNAALLRRFITERGKVMGQAKSGTCARHQRQVALQIKRARHLGLLPFTARVL